MVTRANPAARASASRVLNIDVQSRAFDSRNPKVITPKFQPETLAVRTLMQQFGLTIHHARVVSELAGIGGQA